MYTPSPDVDPSAEMMIVAFPSVAMSLNTSDPTPSAQVLALSKVSVVALSTHAVGLSALIGCPFASFGSFDCM